MFPPLTRSRHVLSAHVYCDLAITPCGAAYPMLKLLVMKPQVRMADDLDRVELLLAQHLGYRLEPLVIRMRSRTLGRVGYMRLRALLTENALIMGQPEETRRVLDGIEKHWRWCPLRYIPWPLHTLSHLWPFRD